MTLEVGKVAGNFYEIVTQKLMEHFGDCFNEEFAQGANSKKTSNLLSLFYRQGSPVWIGILLKGKYQGF